MPSVRLSRLRKSFGPLKALDDVTVSFEEGAMTSVLGPSGCGKTTTLNLVAGFIEPDGGTIHFGERPVADPERGIAVSPHRRNLGMVFQSYALWPHLSVGENVAYGLKMRKVPRHRRDAAVRQALQRVRLAGHVDRYPHELSGGQQQRVALARAIAYSPEILLFDEPLSNLDAQLREEMRSEIRQVHREVGVTAVYVTHDQAEAMALSDRIVVMDEGRVRQVGTPRQLYEEPADARVARLLGRTNVLDAVVVENSGGWARVKVDGLESPLRCRSGEQAQPSVRGAISIRPEGIRLQPQRGGEPAGLTGRVCSALYLGKLNQYLVALPGEQRLEVESSLASGCNVGDHVAVVIDPQCCYFMSTGPASTGGR